MNTEIKSLPFSWNDNFSEIALEDFRQIQKNLPYLTCQSIGMALAKLELLEKQDCKVDESFSRPELDAPHITIHNDNEEVKNVKRIEFV